MPDGTLNVIPEAEAPVDVPAEPSNKRQAGMLITQIGHDLISRKRTLARYDRRIAKHRKKATELEQKKKNLLSPKVEDARVRANVLAPWLRGNWALLCEKGLRLARFGTGEVRLRAVGKPRISIKGDDHEAFFDEVRRLRRATDFIRRPPPEPNLDALRADIPFAQSLNTVEVAYDTVMEIRPKHVDTYFMASLPLDGGDYDWKVGPLKPNQSAL